MYDHVLKNSYLSWWVNQYFAGERKKKSIISIIFSKDDMVTEQTLSCVYKTRWTAGIQSHMVTERLPYPPQGTASLWILPANFSFQWKKQTQINLSHCKRSTWKKASSILRHEEMLSMVHHSKTIFNIFEELHVSPFLVYSPLRPQETWSHHLHSLTPCFFHHYNTKLHVCAAFTLEILMTIYYSIK